jgi:hypothetical protein
MYLPQVEIANYRHAKKQSSSGKEKKQKAGKTNHKKM